MQASNNAIELIKHFEGCRLKAYLCPAKKWTIGWGDTFYENGSPVKAGDYIGQTRADKMLATEVAARAKSVTKLLKVKVTQNLFDALVDWTYNFSESKLNSSAMLRLINEGADTMEEVLVELRKWQHIGKEPNDGLIRRRKAEEHLIKTGELKFYF